MANKVTLKNWQQADTRTLDRIILIAVAFITIGTVFYHFVENFRWVDAYYFTVITLATVGYGDFVPKTDAGKIFTTLYVVIGISIFIALARVLLVRIVRTQQSPTSESHVDQKK